MNDFPPERDSSGPLIIQQMQSDINWLKDMVRDQRIVPSATVQPKTDSGGTSLDVILPAAPQPSRRNTWG
jgi:hypothetical protein